MNKFIANACTAAFFLVSQATGQAADSGPRLLEAVAPTYPMVAVYSGTLGMVHVRVTIDKSGGVIAVKAVDGHKLLQKAAERAAERWRFEPQPDAREALVSFSFNILPKESIETELSTRFRSPYEIEIRHVIPEAMINRDPGATLEKRSGKPR